MKIKKKKKKAYEDWNFYAIRWQEFILENEANIPEAASHNNKNKREKNHHHLSQLIYYNCNKTGHFSY